MGSAKPIDTPNNTQKENNFKLLFQEGYDDGGVADLSLLVDLEDNVLRRKRGDSEYFAALRSDLLPRATKGSMSDLPRRDQKVSLAQLLFSEEEEADKGPSEVYIESVDVDPDVEKKREERLTQSRAALRLSLLLREPSCLCISLSELSKRRLAYYGKEGAEDALRVIEKALEVAGDGYYDREDITLEAEDNPTPPPNYERNATSPGLAHPTTLKYLSIRVSQLCYRSVWLQQGNCLSALGRNEEARGVYVKIIPLLEPEPRCVRVDWERHSLFINIGNTYSREGNFDQANHYYNLAQQLGQDHLDEQPDGSVLDGKNMVIGAKRARVFALKKADLVEEAKALLLEVLNEVRELEKEKENKPVEATN